MCGIVGLVSLSGTPPGETELALVRRMNAAQRHRGPDDEGAVIAGDACLGSTRLSILDLSPAGHMPMASEDRGAVIAYNGEVYNHAELRRELEGLGHRFRSRTDTEVVLAAWREWGSESLERLAGMFAFAVWDETRRELVLARDRLGIKPLHYAVEGEWLVFGSEIKAVQLALQAPRLDARAFFEWALYQSVDAPGDATLLAEVRSLLPGERLCARGGEVAVDTWYSPAERVRPEELARLSGLGTEAAAREIEAAVTRAVSERLMSDVPVGTLLSGGLDSSVITALAAAERPVAGFHVAIDGYPQMDERPFAERVAKHLGIELVTRSLTPSSFRRDLVRTIELSDSPLTHANSVAYLQVCETARENGTIVLLSGEGADELFGGYRWRYRRHRRLLRLGRWLDRLPRRARNALELLGFTSAGLPVESRRFDQLLPQAVQLADRCARFEWQRTCRDAYDSVADEVDRSTLGMMLADLREFLTPLLRRLDHMSMGASVECRVPFLDHRVAELCAHLPLDWRLGRRADKWVLKQVAERHLPRDLVHRKKMGFPLPLADYLAPLGVPAFFAGGFWHEVVGVGASGLAELLDAGRGRPYALLALVSADIWGRLTFLGESVENVHARIEELEHEHARA